jgi:hypothetical protein
VVIADINGDGTPDTAIADPVSGNVNILLGNGDGTLGAPISYATGGAPVALSVANFTGDGRANLVVTGGGADTVWILAPGSQSAFVNPVPSIRR